MIKALFFDIDGTLVSFKTHEIPQSTISALEAAKEKGLKIYISTGRPLSLITNLTKISHLIDGYITTNGAFCFIENEIVSSRPIPKEDVNILIDMSDEMGFASLIVGEKGVIVHNPDEDVKRVFTDMLNVKNIDFNKTYDSIKDQNIFQITAFVNKEREEFLMPYLKDCTSCRWYPDFVDITEKLADKGNGLIAMAKHQGLNISETMAFGDGGNDTSIIIKAGIGVAMGNANQHLKDVADYVTTSVDENGIYNALKHFELI